MTLRILVTLCICAAARADLPAGTIFHFDAAAQQTTRTAAGLPSIGNAQPVDFAVATVPANAVTFQAAPEHRPTFVTDGEAALLKFDGKDDSLLWETRSPALAGLTVFVLAAPKANPGGFSGLFASTAYGRNDYVAGFNLDLGPGSTKELSVVNIESAGAGGFRDLLERGFVSSGERPFGDFHVFCARSQPGKSGVQFFLDGFKGGERDRSDSTIDFRQITVGARIYSNDANQPPFVQGSFDGAIAEVIVFNRALSDAERKSVEESLLAKTVALNGLLHGAKGHALETVKAPPIVQMLIPGFTIEELPLKISNLNNVRYRHDGKVVALGYDGRIHLLSDTNGDGLEDLDELFWDQQSLRSPLGMALLPKNDSRGDGLFVASKGKVSLILDKDRDGHADEEKVIATGWNELTHGVDTLGLAVDPKDGAIYFGLGCANFVDAYQRSNGIAHYSLSDIHGTIQRLSPDFSTRETICTGVRFTCALAFNREGDLFATDQEGATWLSNGNPLDELLHIQRGKHYGFPPGHPKHLPNVMDEPAVIEFGPQHQSTVGMVFNDGVNGGPHFGPVHWNGDALICGESRGKIWRTRLAKTSQGYLAQNQLIACLGMLTVDSCVTPQGDLLVACHSGPPDWGTGPTGEGRLFKIRYAKRELPQPVFSWASASDEFRIAFDRPLDPAEWSNAKDQICIEAGRHVSAGDRFEVIRPGYQVVRDQMASPRRWVQVLGFSFTADLRTMVIRVPRQTEPVNYAVTLPLPQRWRSQSGISQHPQMDLLITLNGLVASVSGMDRVVLPHSSLSASRIFTAGSAQHERFFAASQAPVALEGQVDCSNPFVPAVQPGSVLDWDSSTDSFASAGFAVRKDDGTTVASRPLQVTLPTPTTELYLASDKLRHSMAPARLLVPWASPKSEQIASDTRPAIKGHWLKGRRIFFGESGCATCHTLRGEGTAFGPDLSNLVFRDPESVRTDILHPSATINPDHTGTQVTLKDGVMLSGLMRSPKSDRFTLLLPAGAQTEILRSNVARTEPLKGSLMPEGLGERLTTEQMEDLLAFLLTNPLEPAMITRLDPPKPAPRKISDATSLFGTPVPAGQDVPLRILLCAGPKDHGLDEHDYPLWLERWSKLLKLATNVTVEGTTGFPPADQLAKCDVAVFFNANPGWDAAKAAALDEFHKRGGGAVYLHYGVDGGKDPAGAAERFGLAFTLGSKFRHGDFDLEFSSPDHPITRGFRTIHLTDETYWNMRGDLSRLTVLASVKEEGEFRPQLWTLERYKSRIVGCIPGHYNWTFDDPLYRILVLRSICWAARQQNVDRLAELALIGASIEGR